MDAGHCLGLRQREQVVAAAQRHGVICEACAAEIGLREAVLLHHRAEPAVEQQDPFRKGLFEFRHCAIGSIS